ncbi:MAG TPA: sigma 54-interacting transcriptional regulator [Vicinamibacterales bacterium]|nr:sigma 54-interacting transcriptional regulator [Vicinamibacterales bacterium]HPW20312.1 sigma 54-interacting transcriptional regulator [Vicinamibacterales bacterium]
MAVRRTLSAKRRRTPAPQLAPAPTEAILESISDGVFTVDRDWRITSFNRAAEQITGVSRREAIGQRCEDVFRSSMCGPDCALARTLQSGRPIIGRTAYIIDAEGTRIPISVSTAVLTDAGGRVTGGAETFRDLSELEALRLELEGQHRAGDLSSRSPLMQRVFDALPAMAASPGTILILGETGTGKELVARTIHAFSAHNKGPFVAVNCGALPDTLLESELFGYRAGAFTGAARDKPGRFALARGGTLFLDEIGEVSPALQVRLLRVLQERTFEPLGATRSEQTDARIIVATNRDLDDEVRHGRFREDLYYRVNVLRIVLPPLRQRKEDIPLLADEFVARFNRLQQRAVRGVSAEALSVLMAHDWPGNVRELENAIERAFVLCTDGFIGPRHLPEELTARVREPGAPPGIRAAHQELDVQAIRAAIGASGGDRAAAAKALGIHKTTLFRRIRKLGIELPARDGRSRRRKAPSS